MPEKAEKHPRDMNLPEKAAAGLYELVEPLDYLILEILPNEGELVMGYYPLTKTVPQLRKERFAELTSGAMSGCMKRLTLQSLVSRVRARSSRDYGYQRTPKGRELYEAWKKKQATTNNNNKPPDMSGVGGNS